MLAHKGQLDEAIAEFRQAIRLKKNYAEAHCNLGTVLKQKGLFTEALPYLRLGHEFGSQEQGWRYPSALWVRDCGRLLELDRKLHAILSGPKLPKNPAECLALARLCQMQCKKLYAAATRFYREAFAETPRLPDDMNYQDRYNAACAAALAGYGEGKDADKLDAKERALFRKQALNWLRADLKAYRQVMDKSAGRAGPAIAQRLQHWLKDKDLTGVRDAAALARLSDAEREEWQKLWIKVESLRQRAVRQPHAASAPRS